MRREQETTAAHALLAELSRVVLGRVRNVSLRRRAGHITTTEAREAYSHLLFVVTWAGARVAMLSEQRPNSAG